MIHNGSDHKKEYVRQTLSCFEQICIHIYIYIYVYMHVWCISFLHIELRVVGHWWYFTSTHTPFRMRMAPHRPCHASPKPIGHQLFVSGGQTGSQDPAGKPPQKGNHRLPTIHFQVLLSVLISGKWSVPLARPPFYGLFLDLSCLFEMWFIGQPNQRSSCNNTHRHRHTHICIYANKNTDILSIPISKTTKKKKTSLFLCKFQSANGLTARSSSDQRDTSTLPKKSRYRKTESCFMFLYIQDLARGDGFNLYAPNKQMEFQQGSGVKGKIFVNGNTS